jgi:hypothetical protein
VPMFNWIKDITANVRLRFFSTEDLYAGFDVLNAAKSNHLLAAEVRKAKLRIARELIRRGEIFW